MKKLLLFIITLALLSSLVSAQSLDSDNDGWFDTIDNCPNNYNPPQTDSDNDGVGDACDTSPGCDYTSSCNGGLDSDCDGFNDNIDNCIYDYNPSQDDQDNDGVGDVCDDSYVSNSCTDEACDGGLDSDCDGWFDTIDNCPNTYNPLQTDSDNDGVGDACEPTNNAPILTNNIPDQTWNEDNTHTLNLSNYFNDPDNDSLTYTYTVPTNIGVSVNNNIMTFDPDTNWNGQETMTIVADDGQATVASNQFNLIVQPVNDAPTISNLPDQTIAEDSAVQNLIDLYNYVSDVENTNSEMTFSITSESNTSVVDCSINSNRYLFCTPQTNANGLSDVTIQVSDSQATDTDTTRITITPVNDAPTATDDTLTTNEDTAVSKNLILNDNDVDGDSLNIASVTTPSHGTITTSGNTITYTPDTNYCGSDSASYTVSDSNGGTDTANININVVCVNDAPVVNDDSYTVLEDSSNNQLSVLANDNDVESQLSIQTYSLPGNGTVSVSGNNLVYTPDPDFFGTDTFQYTATDGQLTGTATVTMTVTPVNDAPVANSDTATTNEDTPVSIAVLNNDFDVDSSISIQSTTNPTNGNVVISGDNINYTPNNNFVGTDTFTYTITDGSLTDSAIVTVTVTGLNDNPSWNTNISDVSLAEDFGTYTHIADLNNYASDPDGDALSYSIVSEDISRVDCSIIGTSLVLNSILNWNGNTSCTVRASDGNGGTANDLFNIEVTPVNDAPNAADDVASTNEDTPTTIDVLANDSDPEGDSLSITTVQMPANGNVVIDNNQINYTPNLNFNGLDTFNYTITDGSLTDSASVTVTVSPVNDAPNVNITQPIDGEQFAATKHIQFIAIGSDPDGDNLTYTWNFADGGSSNNRVAYHNYTATGNYTVLVTASDGSATATDTVSIEILPRGYNIVNLDSYADNQFSNQKSSFFRNESLYVKFDVLNLLNGSYSANQINSVKMFNNETGLGGVYFDAYNGTVNGTTIINGQPATPNGTYYYNLDNIPLGDELLGTSLVLVLSIKNGSADHEYLSVAINNNPLVIGDIPDITMADNSTDTSIDLDDYVSDVETPDANILWTYTGNNQIGVVINSSTRIVTITSPAGFSGSETITFTANDTDGSTASDNMTVTVNTVNNAPNAVDDSLTVNQSENLLIDVLANDFDPDGDGLTITSITTPAQGTAAIQAGQINYTAPANYNGTDTFNYTITDGSLADSATVTINISAVSQNNPPAWTNIPSLTLPEDFGTWTHVNLSNYASDPDNDSLSFSIADENPARVDCQLAGERLLLNSVLNWNGNTSCTVRADDGSGQSDESFNITVLALNDAPTLQPIPDQTATENITFNYQVVCSDPDGDALAYGDNTSLFNISSSGLINFTPSFTDTGAHNIKISCSDGSVIQTDTFMLTVNGVQRAPVIKTAYLTAYIGQRFTYQVQASDPNNDPLTYYDNTGLFDINQTSGVISFVPVRSQMGEHTFTITVSDSTTNVSGQFTIKILYDTPKKCSDGLDNDNDGKTDYPDDPGCESPDDNDEFSLENNIEDGVKITSIDAMGFDYYAGRRGDYLLVRATLENTIDEDIDGLVLGAMIPEAGLKEDLQGFSLDSGQRRTISSYMYIPESIDPGYYYLGIHVSNSDLTRKKYVPIRIV